MNKEVPHAIDVEATLLGTMLAHYERTIAAYHRLPSTDIFFHAPHRRIFSAMKRLFDKRVAADVVAVAAELKSDPGFTPEDVEVIADASVHAGTPTSLDYYIEVLIEKKMMRDYLRLADEIQHEASDPTGDCFHLTSVVNKEVAAISALGITKNGSHIGGTLSEALLVLEAMRKGDKKHFGIDTGYRELDGIVNGFAKGSLIVLGGRPSMGKTALALSMAVNMAAKTEVEIFSLEMSREEILLRLLSQTANVPYELLKNGHTTDDHMKSLASAKKTIDSLKLYLDDTASLSVAELKNKMQRAIHERNTQVFFVDYLQLMRMNNKGNKNDEVGIITRELKVFAKDYGKTIVLLSQLNRGLEVRQDKRPRLSDLRDSGNIEQDTDVVIFVYRDEVYGNPLTADGRPTAGIAEAIVSKNRNGRIGKSELFFRGEIMRFDNADAKHDWERSMSAFHV